MPLKANVEAIHAEIEVTYNTDPTPTSAETMRAARGSMDVRNLNGTVVEVNFMNPGKGWTQAFHTGHYATISFDIMTAGAGGVDTPPLEEALLLACATSQTITGATEVDHDPVTTSLDSVTIYANVDGQLAILTGCRGNVVERWNINGIGIMSFTFWGNYNAPTSAAAIATDFTGWQVPPVVNKTNWTVFSVHGTALLPREFSIDWGNQLTYWETGGAAATGIIDINTGNPICTVAYEQVARSTWNPEVIALANTEGAFITSLGTASGGIIEYTAVQAQIMEPRERREEGYMLWEHGLRLNASAAGNDEFQRTTR